MDASCSRPLRPGRGDIQFPQKSDKFEVPAVCFRKGRGENGRVDATLSVVPKMTPRDGLLDPKGCKELRLALSRKSKEKRFGKAENGSEKGLSAQGLDLDTFKRRTFETPFEAQTVKAIPK